MGVVRPPNSQGYEMALRVSTTGSDVFLYDLGILIVDPTTDRDLSLEFTSEELKDSEDLTNAIQNGDLTVDDGQFEINATDYDPNEVTNQELLLKLDRRFISHDELSAGHLDTPIVSGVFPLSLNSTAAVTRNVYVPSARWGTWQIDADDKVEIEGSSAADGIYTVESISDHQNFIVVESIADSTGGNITVYHPNAATNIGINNNNFNNVSGVNLQDLLEDIDDKITLDVKVKVSSNDSTSGFLTDKLVGGYGRGINLNELNDGSDEDLELKPFNLYPEEQSDLENTIYVRTTGDDTTGDGSSGTPYRTIKRALEDIPYLIYGERFIIDCTDLGQEAVTSPIQLPIIKSPDSTYYDSSPDIAGFTVRAPLTIQAEPTVLDTISGVELSGQTSDSVTTLRTLQTTKNYTLNQYQGKFVRAANGAIYVIASNTAGPNSDIETTSYSNLTAPIEIIEPSAEIRNTSTGNAVESRHIQSKVQFNGIQLTVASASSWRYGIFIESSSAQIGFKACYIDGVFALNGLVGPSYSSVYFTKRAMATGVAHNMFNCFAKDAVIAGRNSGSGATDINFWFGCIFDGCYAIGESSGINEYNRMSISLDRAYIKNGLSDGVYAGPGFLGRIRRTRIDSCAGHGIYVIGNNNITLLEVTGVSNSSLGLKLMNGCQVLKSGTVDITGTGGDYQVGANSIGTWGGFSGDENDLGATSPKMCRLFV